MSQTMRLLPVCWSRRPVFVLPFLFIVAGVFLSHLKGAHCQPETLADPTLAGNLKRPKEHVEAEKAVDSNIFYGFCHQNKSLLPDVFERVCQPPTCLLQSRGKEKSPVDLTDNPLEKLDKQPPESCQVVVGGQEPFDRDIPVVSLVVPLVDDGVAVGRLLVDLFRTAHEVRSVEYIVVSDGLDTHSEELVLHAASRLYEHFGVMVRIKRLAKKVGLADTVNEGAVLATGKYIVVVSPRVVIFKGWLHALVTSFYNKPRIGIVGPLILGPDDTAWHSGGYLYADGTAAIYNKAQQLDHDMNYLREVDFVSSSCFAIHRSLVKKLPLLFDPAYQGSYYMAADLGMRALAEGYKVMFQPLSVLRYTSENEEEKQIDQRTAEMKPKFFAQYKTELAKLHCQPMVVPERAMRWKVGPKVIWIDDKVAEIDRDSGSVRTLNILRLMVAEGIDVTFQPLNQHPERTQYYEPIMRYHGINVKRTWPPAMWTLKDSRGYCQYDAVFIARRAIFQQTIPTVSQECPCAPIIYDTVDLHFLREARGEIVKTLKDRWDLAALTVHKIIEWLDSGKPETTDLLKLRDKELRFMDQSKVVVVVSDVEKELIQHYRPSATISILTNTHDLGTNRTFQAPKNCAERSGALFVGSFNHPPNKEAVTAFIEDVLPLVLEKLPADQKSKFVFNVVGSDPPSDEMLALFKKNEAHVKFHGYLPEPELQQLFRSVKVFAAALLSGAGVKGKVNQAMKYGLPVIGTPIAFEAMHGQDGVNCRVAGDAAQFAARLVEVYTDCDLWVKLVLGGYKNVHQKFGMPQAKKAILEILAAVKVSPHRVQPQKCPAPLVEQGK